VRAVILAAGYATRLRPYTEAFPKTLLRISGKPLLDDTVDNLLEDGDRGGSAGTGRADSGRVDRITIVTNERFRHLFDAWARGRRATAGMSAPGGSARTGSVQAGSVQAGSVPIRVISDGTSSNAGRLGSIGDLRLAIETEGAEEDLLVLSSDKLVSFRFSDLLRFFRRTGHTVNTCFDTGDVASVEARFGCAVVEADGLISDFQEKPANPRSSVKSIAFYVYPREVLPLVGRYLDGGGNPDAPGHFSEWLCRRVPMYAWLLERDCRDVGTPESYLEARALCLRERSGPAAPSRFVEIRAMVVYPGPGSGAALGGVAATAAVRATEVPPEDREALERIVSALAEWPQVTLIYVAAAAPWSEAVGAWRDVAVNTVPVNVVRMDEGMVGPYENGARGAEGKAASLAEKLGCRVVLRPGRSRGRLELGPGEPDRSVRTALLRALEAGAP